MDSESTIVALATAHGNSALAVIRISGPRAFSCVKNIVDKKDAFETSSTRVLGLYRLRGTDGRIIDHVSAIKYSSPRTFTGEDMVEIICHGGKLVVEKVLEALIGGGAVYARRGEFTRRAFLNGKLELAEAEAIERIVSSRTVAQHRNAVESYFGGYRGSLQEWREKLEKVIVEIESSIEFGEEDHVGEADVLGRARLRLGELRAEVEAELRRRACLIEKENGIEVAFIGVPNVGKSTLLNLVLGYDRSIVFEEEGTTRDAVSEWVSWHGLDVRFVDSAGIRKCDPGVEKLGVERSWQYVEKSDFVILVTSAGQKWREEEEEVLRKRAEKGAVLGIVNKVDLASAHVKEDVLKKRGIPCLSISALNAEHRDLVIDFLSTSFEEVRGDIVQDTIVCTKRQEGLMRTLVGELVEAQSAVETAEEVAAHHVRRALGLLDEFVGKSCGEEILNAIFDRFCIGK